jgi:protein SCO1
MKPKATLIVLIAFTLAMVLSALAIHRQVRTARTQSVKEFSVRGVVKSVEPENKTVRITHEEIPGYMPAMTMPLAVKEAAILNGLQSGDAVKFRLIVTEDDSWISKIEKDHFKEELESDFSARAQAGSRESERLQAGERVSDFVLTDQNGRATRLSDFKGKAVILTFVYTRCPLPNFCPLMSKNFAGLQSRLGAEFPDRFQLISVSIDPKFDTPEVLKSYSGVWSKDEKTWSFLTGTPDEIENVGALFGLFHEPTGGLINHDLRTALIGPDGKLVHIWKSNVWTPYEVQRAVRETLTGRRDLTGR